jgi:hypothetical protein
LTPFSKASDHIAKNDVKTLADIPDAKCNPNIKVGSNLISKVYQRHAWFPFGLVTPIIGVTLGDVEARGVCDILSVSTYLHSYQL